MSIDIFIMFIDCIILTFNGFKNMKIRIKIFDKKKDDGHNAYFNICKGYSFAKKNTC